MWERVKQTAALVLLNSRGPKTGFQSEWSAEVLSPLHFGHAALVTDKPAINWCSGLVIGSCHGSQTWIRTEGSCIPLFQKWFGASAAGFHDRTASEPEVPRWHTDVPT